jgi:hypothetical protein
MHFYKGEKSICIREIMSDSCILVTVDRIYVDMCVMEELTKYYRNEMGKHRFQSNNVDEAVPPS